MFHVKHGGMAELWGRQFEKYHFSPTRYRGVSVSRETWVRDVLGLGRCVYGKLGCFVLFGFMVMWWFHVEHGSFSCRENMIQLLKTLMHVTILWRFGKAS